MKSYWREQAAPIVARVLAETAGQEERVIKKALAEAYPFTERRGWAYKAWLIEVKAQRRPLAQPAEYPPVVGGLFDEEER